MKRFLTIIFALLGLLLPLHGGITVFFPENFRWWKEILLGILFFVVITNEIRTFFLIKNKNFIQKLKSWKTSLKIPEIFSIGILLLIFFLILLSSDIRTSAEAGRYLGLPFFVFFIISRIQKIPEILRQESTTETFPLTRGLGGSFIHFFILGCTLSIAFGIWVQSGLGINFVQNFYSNTISSWVPGQTLPIWHEASGLMRMQGLTSGPIELSHLALAGLAIIPSLQFRKATKLLLVILFFSGIFFSYSRAAMLGGIIISLFHFFFTPHPRAGGDLRYTNISKIPVCTGMRKKRKIFLFSGIFLTIIFSSFFIFKNNNFTQKIFSRAGTSQHITRPIEAFHVGIQSPLRGNMGKLGPAARAKNLRENNSDKALIAENVFVDYFAQLGIFGLLLFLGFWRSVYQKISKKFLGFFWVSMGVFCLATVFDMTPISITYMVLFAFFANTDRTNSHT